ncbi:ABC transporter substrate-binding protein [Macrococcus armenti]|uniref:ABC transporter substrate-binding protein n=1 Tax=Macrococcus armenti TaxID=2875764 RepID=A0ABY3ZVL6_9STAP|nr:ABC transporter substrate-binding protein [Macrococcus armenti]UOB20415.1 ABC transporter substrate-binding protein [Macrococcus armenti]
MMDNRLLKLKYFLEQRHYQFALVELSEYFKVSERQMGRLLKKWQEEQYINYIPASGRGNSATIQFVVDVENLLLQEIIDTVPTLSVEELQEILSLPFEEKSIHRLQLAVNKVALNIKEEDVTIPYEYLPDNIHPSNIVTTEEAQVVYQVFETLYKLTSDGKIKGNLVAYDEWVGNDLHLYLKKGINFSNGEVLIAKDVKFVLENLKDNSNYTRVYNKIVNIEVISDFKLVLEFESKPKLFEYNLAARYSAIYKDINEDYLIGTGPYYISNIDGNSIEMSYNAFYRGAHPEIQSITFSKDLAAIKKRNAGISTRTLETHFGNEFLLFNPFKKTTKAQRIFLADMLLESIHETIGEDIGIAHPTKQYEPGDLTLNLSYVKVLVVEFNKNVFLLFREKLKAFGIEVVFYETTNEEYINTNLMNIDVDFVWMFESYNEQQPFKTLDLLTHCKFQEWYADFDDARKITEKENYRPHESLKTLCHSFLRKVELMKYMIPIFVHKKYIDLPHTMKNIKEQPYGTIDYRMIINDKEE